MTVGYMGGSLKGPLRDRFRGPTTAERKLILIMGSGSQNMRHMQQTQLYTDTKKPLWLFCGHFLAVCAASRGWCVASVFGIMGASHTPQGLLSQKLSVLIGRMLRQDVEFMLIRDWCDSSGPDNGDV